tara:strand:+ start:2211 stop:2609 length:399 start_codon:yes stop_codon:yes gene_type:complete
MKFNHIGIIVEDLNLGLNFFKSFLEIDNITKTIVDETLGVNIKFFKDISGLQYELISPLNSNSPITYALEQNKNILNHVAYTSKNFDLDMQNIRKSNSIILGAPKKAKAFNNARVVFFLTTLGMIIELIEEY